MKINIRNKVRFDEIEEGEAFLSLEGTPYIKIHPVGKIGFNSVNLVTGYLYYWAYDNIVDRRQLELVGV